MIVSSKVHVANVSFIVNPKYSLNIQNPASLTCEAIKLPAPVAKTTSAVAVAECFASQGHRTLLIDADHQCMAGELLLDESRLLRADKAKKTLHDLMSAMLDDDFGPEQI